MSSDLIMIVVVGIIFTISTIISVMVMIRALAIRKALVDKLYRGRALWTAIAAVGLIGIISSYTIDSLASAGYRILANSNTALLVEDVSWGLSFLALYGWILSNINVALSSDFLHIDTLSWKRGGKSVFVFSLVIPYILASLPPVSSLQAFINTFSNFLGIIFAVATIYAAIVLAITFRRIKDRLIRNYTKWVGVSLILVVLWIVASSFALPALIFAAYAMYRAAGSLVIRTHTVKTE